VRKLTNDEFIRKSNITHNNKYLYSRTEYISSNKKVIITCNEHGDFLQEANSHLRGIGCPKCSGVEKSNSIEFIKKSKSIHDNYGYSLVEYINAKTKVKIICQKHGIFEQTPNNHLSGFGCNKCGCEITNKKNSKDLENFIIDCKKVHGDKYDYSLVEYINAKVKVKIICPIHGYFYQRPDNHLVSECKKCSIKKSKLIFTKTHENFIIDCKKVHGDKYDYSLVSYKGTDFKIKIICPEHGIFEQKCCKHLQSQGCPICSESKLEKEVRVFLIENNILFKHQYGRIHDSFYLNGQVLDFYLPEYNIAIECQGDQHFRPVDFGNRGDAYAYNDYIKNISRDIKKYSNCSKKGVEIFYYCGSNSYYDGGYEYIGKIYDNLEKLMENL
jgi:hypothetical protein